MKQILVVLSLLVVSVAARAESGILVLGDSLSAAYGMERERGWVQLLQQRLEDEGYPQQVTNASISGETSAGGLRRLPALLKRHKPALVIVELGANDGLRAQPLDMMQRNLENIIKLSYRHDAAVLLLGMYIPTNYGRSYVERFHSVYGRLAREHGTGLVDFMLAPIALDSSRFLADRIHPNAESQPILLDHLWPAIKQSLDELPRADSPPVEARQSN